MTHRSIRLGLLAAALTLTLPAMAISKDKDGEDRGNGRRDRGRSEWKRGDSRGDSRGESRRRDSQPDQPARGETRWRPSGGDARWRDTQPDVRADRRSRGDDGQWQGDAPRRVAGYTITRDRYRTTTRYRGGSPYYRPHHFYYTGYFSRPRFVYRSGISIGFAINLTPSYGYSYYDPYCHIRFRSIGDYYDHCEDLGHAEAILMMYGGSPIATCVYDDGSWVVDDCY